MPEDLTPEYFLDQLKNKQLSPFYLFYGESRFRLEKALDIVRGALIPEESRGFNLHIFYGDKAGSTGIISDIIDTAQTVPFMCPKRLIIVRRTELFPVNDLAYFIPYLEMEVESTCLIFISSKPDFRKKFYNKIRKLGRSVNFNKLYDNQIMPWIKRLAKELGLDMEEQAFAYFHQIVGNRLQFIYSELEKLLIRYGKKKIGIKEVKELAIFSRTFTIFELMDAVSSKQGTESLTTLKRFLEEEGRDGHLRIMGMLNRQIRLLWQTKLIIEEGGRMTDVCRKLGLGPFQAKKLMPQSRHWNTDDLEQAFHLLYLADGQLKSGFHTTLALENVIFSLCTKS